MWADLLRSRSVGLRSVEFAPLSGLPSDLYREQKQAWVRASALMNAPRLVALRLDRQLDLKPFHGRPASALTPERDADGRGSRPNWP